MNKAEHLQIVELYRKNNSITIKELSRLFKRKPATISKILRENGVTPQYNRTRKLDPSIKKLVMSLYLQGLTMEQIAKHFDIADGSVYNIVNEEPLCQTEEY